MMSQSFTLSREHDYFWLSGGYIVESLVNNICQKGNVDIDDGPINPLLMFQHLYCIFQHNKVLVETNTGDQHFLSLEQLSISNIQMYITANKLLLLFHSAAAYLFSCSLP